MPTSTRSSKPRGTSSSKSPVIVAEPEPDPDPPMVLGDVYPEDTMPKPKINPALFTNNTGSLRRLSESLKVALVQSELSAKGILTSGCYKPPELMEDLLRDFNKYGVYFKEPNTPFLNSLDSSSQLT